VNRAPSKTFPDIRSITTVVEPFSQWIDTQLACVIQLYPSYLKDGWPLIWALHDIRDLLPNIVCYTVDAISMYSNINKDHGIATFEKWLEHHHEELPQDFPIALILDRLDNIMLRHYVTPLGPNTSFK
jgi:hypothetical protein